MLTKLKNPSLFKRSLSIHQKKEKSESKSFLMLYVILIFILWMVMILKENSPVFWDMKQPELLKALEKESPELLLVMLSSLVTLLNVIKRSAFTVNMKNQTYVQKSDQLKVLDWCQTDQLVSEQKMVNKSSILWDAQHFLNTQ